MNLYFYISVVILALLLFFPVSRLIWIMSVRRLTRKLNRQLTQEEIKGQKNRARFIATLAVSVFSWLFNYQLLGAPTHG